MVEIVLGVTGSIGAYKAADLVRLLKERGCAVSCVLTKEAEQFITPLTLQALSERKVARDLFSLETPPSHSSGGVRNPRPGNRAAISQGLEDAAVIHTQLADRASVLVIAPATANIIAKLAHGLADDLLTCVALATKAPILLAPAMNVHMYEHPVTQENLKRLKALGYHTVGPQVGKLACGYDAMGHVADVEEIAAAALRLAPPLAGAGLAGGQSRAPRDPPAFLRKQEGGSGTKSWKSRRDFSGSRKAPHRHARRS